MQDCGNNPELDQDCTHNPEFSLGDISERDKLWDKHRAAAQTVEQLYREAGMMKHGDRVHDCSRFLGFLLQAQDTGELKLKLSDARFCRSRHCPVCQWRKSLMWRARFLAALPRVMEAYPDHRWVFLTLTLRNVPIGELRETLRHLSKSWERLSKRKVFPAVGSVRSLEITRSDIGEAHPHFHIMLLMPPSYFSHGYINKAEWQDLWSQALRVNYPAVTHIKAVRVGRLEGKHGIINEALHVLKYGVKVDDLVADAEWLAELTHQVKGARSVNVSGVLRDFIKDEEPEDLIGEEEDKDTLIEHEAELWFSWRDLQKKYRKVSS